MGASIAFLLFFVGSSIDVYRILCQGENYPRYMFVGPIFLVALLLLWINSDRWPTATKYRSYSVAKTYGDQVWLKGGRNYTFNPSVEDYAVGDRVDEICRKAPLMLVPDDCWIKKEEHIND
jgi:hypothetical protein